MTPSPLQDPGLWQTVGLGQAGVMPPKGKGAARVSPKVGQKVDEKSPAGKKRSSQTQTGEKEPEFSIVVRFTAEAWPEMYEIIRYIKPPRGPFDATHPVLELYDVTSLQVTDIAGPEWDEHQIGTITITAKGWTSPDEGAGCTTLLMRGSTGAEVSRWATFLNAPRNGENVALIVPIAVDGIFGTEMYNATREFQAEESILVDGIVGPQTFGAAKKYGYAPPPPKACGSATKTATAADPTQFGPPSYDQWKRTPEGRAALAESREAAKAAFEAAGVTPNEDGYGLPADWSWP